MAGTRGVLAGGGLSWVPGHRSYAVRWRLAATALPTPWNCSLLWLLRQSIPVPVVVLATVAGDFGISTGGDGGFAWSATKRHGGGCGCGRAGGSNLE